MTAEASTLVCRAGRQHVGLTGMRERVHSLGGTLTLATSPGQGTRITVTVPIHPSKPATLAEQPAAQLVQVEWQPSKSTPVSVMINVSVEA